MSIVDCQNYPKGRQKTGICRDCRSYREKESYKSSRLRGYCLLYRMMPGLGSGYDPGDGNEYGEVNPTGSCDWFSASEHGKE